jgi:hypothetical protein
MGPRPPAGVAAAAGAAAELATDLGAEAVAAGLGAAVPGTEEQPAITAAPASTALARTERSWRGPVSGVRPENLRSWLLTPPSLTPVTVRRLRQST